MFTIRCTQTLLKRLSVASLPAGSVEPTTTLGDWYANPFNVGRLRLLLCTSERSLLTVIVPAAPLADFPERLRIAVADMLDELGVPAADVAREQREMALHRFDRTRSRQVLGSMNDFAFLADVYIRDRGPDADLAAVARMLNRAPCTPIQHQSPERFAPALFRGASEEPRSHGPPPSTLAIHRPDHIARNDRAIYRIKVALRDIRPPIWRRIEVESDISLLAFHRILQAAMGWTDSHLHQFIQNGTYYGTPDPEFDMPIISERRTRLGDLLEHPKDRLTYEYDFGDSWEHDVVLEAVSQPEPRVRYPRIVAGKRACPPEDVGGFPGYAELLEVIRDPAHEEHASMLEWLGGRFDPERFDVAGANDSLPNRRAARPRG